jgi:hypothetical protein
MKDHLIFDVTDATSIHDSDSVGAYVRASDGTLITHHTDGGSQALDVHVTNPTNVNVDINGIYDGSTNLLPANVGLIGSSRAAPGLANQTLQFTGAAPSADGVLSNIIAQDVNSFGMLWNGSSWDRAPGDATIGAKVSLTNTSIAVTQSTSPWVVSGTVDLSSGTLAALESITVQNPGGAGAVNIQDGGNSITVDGSVSITGTAAVTQSGTWTVGLSEDHNYGTVGANTLRTAAQIGNATGAADFNSGVTTAQTLRVTLASDNSITTSDAALANSTVISTAKSIAVTVASAVTSPLTGRKYLWIYNNSNKQIFIGGATASLANGFPISPGSYMEMRAGAAAAVGFIGQAASGDIRTLEAS